MSVGTSISYWFLGKSFSVISQRRMWKLIKNFEVCSYNFEEGSQELVKVLT